MTKKKLLRAMIIATIAIGLVACSRTSNESTDDATTVKSLVTTTNIKTNASYTIDPTISQAYMDKNIIDLREQIIRKINTEKVSNFLKVKDNIYNSDLTPKSDVKDPTVVIYEFFDYQCIYCSKLSLEIDKTMADHKDTQVAFVEFPIFGEKALYSEYAAEVGTAIYKLNGAKTYVKYHDSIFATGKDVNEVAKDVGADITKIKLTIKNNKIAEHLKAILEIGFKELGIQGTPYIVVAPVKDANPSNTTVIAGYIGQAGITDAILKAKTTKY